MRANTGEQVDSYIPVIHDRIESDRLGFNWIGSDRIGSRPISDRRGWSKRIMDRITVNHIWHNLTELFVVYVFKRIKVEESTSIGASWRNEEDRWDSLTKIPGRLLDHFAFLFPQEGNNKRCGRIGSETSVASVLNGKIDVGETS